MGVHFHTRGSASSVARFQIPISGPSSPKIGSVVGSATFRQVVAISAVSCSLASQKLLSQCGLPYITTPATKSVEP